MRSEQKVNSFPDACEIYGSLCKGMIREEILVGIFIVASFKKEIKAESMWKKIDVWAHLNGKDNRGKCISPHQRNHPIHNCHDKDGVGE